MQKRQNASGMNPVQYISNLTCRWYFGKKLGEIISSSKSYNWYQSSLVSVNSYCRSRGWIFQEMLFNFSRWQRMMLYRQSRAEVVIRGIRVKNSNISSFNGSPSREWRFSLFSEFQSVNIAHLFLLTCEMKRILLVIVFDEQEKWFLFPARDWLEGKSAGSQLTYFVLKFCVYIPLSYTNSGKSKGRRD